EGDKMDDEGANEEDDADELYKDVNINLEGQNIQMTNVQATQLEAEVLTRSSNSSKTSYAVAADLSKLELEKILIDMIKSNKSNWGSKRRRAGKEPESTSAPKEKTSKTSRKSTEGSKSHHKTTSESAPAEEPMHTTQDLEAPRHQEFKIEGDFKRLCIQDIEDMVLLLVQGKLTNLTVDERFAFNVSLRMFTRSIVIQRRVEVFQLGVDLLSGSRDTNLYIIYLDDMLKTSPICLLSKASKTKSWLWHRRLSYLNFSTINKLAKDGLVRGILRLKFQKDQMCSACALACALGKSKKSFHQPKAEDTNQEKLYLLHMNLYGSMRVESINRKKYILVIVDDYSRFTWVKFLRSKNEAPDAIIKCIKNIQVRLNATVFQEAAALRAVVLADSLVSTSIDQDDPSKSIPSTQEQEHSPTIS
nr:integrase, catalytic region, zinc finger, CCHC-type, peptidase aspartic, catalytic [Tanacetum cinerariifolium]